VTHKGLAMPRFGALETLAQHWREYLMEAAELGFFMLAACAFTFVLYHPASLVARGIESAPARRALGGLAMGLTAISIIYSPWGKQSGAHLNPAVTLTFYRLGRIARADALFYVLAQFGGAVAGIGVATLLLGRTVLSHPSVRYVVTVPGEAGVAVAFAAEALIAFGMMLTVLALSNRPALNRYTGLVAGALVAIYIAIEAPLSGMSMNAARTFGSALAAHDWTAIWLYFAAPLAGMLAAAELYVRVRGEAAVLCCKLHHDNDKRCIFRCRYGMAAATHAVRARDGTGIAPQGANHG
jgi:aquaporin Z